MKPTAILFILATVACLCPSAQAEEDAPTPAARLIATHADSIVSIKYVQSMQIPMVGQDEESSGEARGILISKDGLVLTSSTTFDGGVSGGTIRMMGQEIEVKVSVSALKVLFGTEEKEYDAQLVAKDSNLGLAFLKIQDLGDREVQPLALDGIAKVAVGKDILALGRMSRGFDCAPLVTRGYVRAAVERPREMYASNIASGDLLGMPAFTKAGSLVGFLSVQTGVGAAESGGGGLLGMLRSGGGGGAFVIPAEAIQPLVAAAAKRAEELAAEAAAEDAEEADADDDDSTEDDSGE